MRKLMESKRNIHFAGLSRAAVPGGATLLLLLLVLVPALLLLPANAASELASGPSSGLPIPRFVSLKPDKVNVRGGPTRHHDVTWQYTRSGLPVEITAESDNWRRIRDWEGSEGWVYHTLLSGRRTALVISKSKDEPIPVYDSADNTSRVAARLQPGVIASVKRCTGRWCQISGSGFAGWIAQERLWGVYPDETLP